MKAKDLMIGDLVRVNRDVCIKNDTIVRVCGIDATNRLVEKGLEGSATCVPVDDIDFYSGGIWVKYLSPIPLTPEILEKNGFRLMQDVYVLASEKWQIYIIQDVGKWFIDIRNEIAAKDDLGRADLVTFLRDWTLNFYVHELQHALRLCGIDKEIVI